MTGRDVAVEGHCAVIGTTAEVFEPAEPITGECKHQPLQGLATEDWQNAGTLVN